MAFGLKRILPCLRGVMPSSALTDGTSVQSLEDKYEELDFSALKFSKPSTPSSLGYKFSEKSKRNLDGVHPLLDTLFNEAIKHVDFTVLEGLRSEERQLDLFNSGKSKTLNSKHLVQEDGFSHAVDAIAYPIKWNNSPRNYMFAGVIFGIAKSMGIQIRCGADWDINLRLDPGPDPFNDLVHFEITR